MNEIMMKPVCTNCGHIFKKVVQENERLDPLDGERTFLKLVSHSIYPRYCPECGMVVRNIIYQKPVDCDGSTIYYNEPEHEYTLKDKPEPEIYEPGKHIFVVYGDTYFDGYGSYINLFGVFEDEQTAMKVKEDMEEKYYKDSLKNDWMQGNVEKSDIKFKIQEIPVNKMCDIYLGGYAE